MQIERIKISELKPYKLNAKEHPQSQIDKIKQSIQDFGFNDPIAIDEANGIIEGHGRLQAMIELGEEYIDAIRLSHLTDEQKRAYILVHNKLTLETGFDKSLLELELGDIENINMEFYGFEMPDDLELPEAKDTAHPEERIFEVFNFDDYDPSMVEGRYDMPILLPSYHIPEKMIGFNYAKTTKEYDACIHFYLDDYQFERLWNSPYEYIELLKKFDCCLTPNFSIYLDFPEPIKIYNTYRSRLLGQIMQRFGIETIPIVYWSDEKSFDWCFDGLPENSVLSVNTIGNKNKEAEVLWNRGMDELIKRKHPRTLLIYGNGIKPDYDFGDVEVIYYENQVTQKWKNS